MMTRFSYYDTDAERLPEDMMRVGYDADTQVYTYMDADGSYWEGVRGARYGRLTRLSDGPEPELEPSPSTGMGHEADPFMSSGWEEEHNSWRQTHKSLINFFVVIRLFLRRHAVPIPGKLAVRPHRARHDRQMQYLLGTCTEAQDERGGAVKDE